VAIVITPIVLNGFFWCRLLFLLLKPPLNRNSFAAKWPCKANQPDEVYLGQKRSRSGQIRQIYNNGDQS